MSSATRDELKIGDDRYLSAQQAAADFGFNGDYIARLARQGNVGARHVGTNWYVDERSLRAWLQLPGDAPAAECEQNNEQRSSTDTRARIAASVFTHGHHTMRLWHAPSSQAATTRTRTSRAAPLLVALALASAVTTASLFPINERALLATAPARHMFAASASSPLFDNVARYFYKTLCPFLSDCTVPSSPLAVIAPTSDQTVPLPQTLARPAARSALATTTIIYQTVSQPVVERIIERTQDHSASPVFEPMLDQKLAALTQALRLELTSRVTANVTGTAAPISVATFAASQRINDLSNVHITNATVSGISGLAAADIPALNYVPISGGTLTGAIEATGATFGNSTTTNATSTTFFSTIGRFSTGVIDTLMSTIATIGTITATNYTATNATTTNATTTNLAVIGTATSTFTSGISAARLNASATSTLSGLVVDSSGLRLAAIDCSSYGNGGKLTSDAFGYVICGANSGGAGSTVAGANTQIQFNDAGSFGGDGGFTYIKTAGRLTVVNASTTNLTASYASSTSLFAGTLTLSSSLSASSGGTGIASPSAAGVLLGGYAGGDWQQIATSSLGLLTTNVAEGSNLYFTTDRVASVIAGTTTDALAQGSTNKYYSTLLFASDLAGTTTTALAEGANKYYTDARAATYISGSSTVPHIGGSAFGDLLSWTGSSWATRATSTLALNTDNLVEGSSNLFWTNTRFDNRLAATTTLPNLTTLASLATVGTITSGTWNGSTIGVPYGGTGWAAIQSGAIPYGNSSSALATTTAGTAGYVLAYLNGVPTWTATTTLTNISGTLAIESGGTGQTSFAQGWLNSDGSTISASTSPTVNYITATSTTATSTISTGGFTVGGSYLVVQQGSGNVGIGIASPVQALDITRAFGIATGIHFAQSGVAEAGFGFKASDSTLYITNEFGAGNSLGLASQSIALTNTGNVGIGTTSPANLLHIASTGNAIFDIDSGTGNSSIINFKHNGGHSSSISWQIAANSGGNFNLYDGGFSQGVYISQGSTGWSAVSDRRLKTNIQTLNSSSGLSAIEQLNPVTFNWIDSTSGTQIGFIAQEVQNIFPYLVTNSGRISSTTPDGTLGVNYIGFIPPLVKAVQEIASISGVFKDALIAWLADTANGITKLFAGEGHFADKLCVGETCVTPAQFQAMVAGANQSAGSGGTATSSDAAAGNSPQVTSTSPDTEPPIITINGNNPAELDVGDVYNDLGASVRDNVDYNLGIHTFVGTTPIDQAVIDTSAPTTYHIYYVATDGTGNTATSTRSVIIESVDASSRQ